MNHRVFILYSRTFEALEAEGDEGGKPEGKEASHGGH